MHTGNAGGGGQPVCVEEGWGNPLDSHWFRSNIIFNTEFQFLDRFGYLPRELRGYFYLGHVLCSKTRLRLVKKCHLPSFELMSYIIKLMTQLILDYRPIKTDHCGHDWKMSAKK